MATTLRKQLERYTIIAAAALAIWRPAVTHAAPAETTTIYRAQVKIWTCNANGAGTNNIISAQLNDANRTYLDYPHDDFEANTALAYDLSLTGVKTLKDIQKLEISSFGVGFLDDKLCLKKVGLYVNNVLVFSADYGSGFWLKSMASYLMPGGIMRAHPMWMSYKPSGLPPLSITRKEMVSRVASATGDALARTSGADWGFFHGDPIEVTRKNDHTVHVDLDLRGKCYDWYCPDWSEVDVDFDVEFQCTKGTVSVKATNPVVDVDLPWWADAAVWIADLFTDIDIAGDVAARLNDAMKKISFNAQVPMCPKISVDSGANVKFGL